MQGRIGQLVAFLPAGLARRLTAVAVLVLALSGCGTERSSEEQIAFDGPTMGTYYSVKIARPAPDLDLESLRSEIRSILDRVVAEISTYDPDSELSRLNANPSTGWVAVSSNLLRVLAEGQRLARLSDGAFDITIGPLVDLWGFGPAARRATAPDSARIAAARARVGYRKLHLRESPPAVRKARGDLSIDLSALGEGYGADEVAAWLDARGVTDYMVAVAGAIRAKGRNAQGRPWAIAIEEPLADRRAVHRIIAVSGRGLSTSGDYRNFFEQDGRRYSHEIDPVTGLPVGPALGSVTVVADRAMVADGLATALMVLGAERGVELARREGLAAYFILRDQDGVHGLATPGFASMLDPAQP